jgi:hypothetical protein
MAVGVMDDEPLARAEQFVGKHERADGIVAGRSSGVADDLGVALDETGEFSGVETGVHATKAGEVPRKAWQDRPSCRSLNCTAGWL